MALECKFCRDESELLVSTDELTYYQCIGCCSIFSYPIPSKQKLLEFYDGSYWFDHQRSLDRPVITERIEHDYKIAVKRMEMIQKRILAEKSSSLLDVGCSNGALVKRALSLGFDAHGIEISDKIADIARKTIKDPYRILTYSIEDYAELLSNTYNSTLFDVVVLNDVIEHVRKPTEVIKQISKLTEQLIVIEAPNPECEEAIQQGNEWRHIGYKEHLNLLSIRAISYLFSLNGFYLTQKTFPIPSKFALYFKKQMSRGAGEQVSKGAGEQRSR